MNYCRTFRLIIKTAAKKANEIAQNELLKIQKNWLNIPQIEIVEVNNDFKYFVYNPVVFPIFSLSRPPHTSTA